LTSGIAEQLENSVQGYFLALTLLLKNFKDNVDFEMFIKYIVDETAVGKAQTKSERKELALGRLLILSTFVEAKVFTPSKGHNATTLPSLISSYFFEICRIWNQQSRYRESILKVIEKVIQSVSETNPEALPILLSTLAKYILVKPIDDLIDPTAVLKFRVTNDADYMSLYIVMKNALKQPLEYDSYCKVIANWDIESEKVKLVFKQMQKMLIEETVSSAFPRPHNVVKYLIDYLIDKKAKKAIKSLWKVVFEQF
jgi:hypothetical protein